MELTSYIKTRAPWEKGNTRFFITRLDNGWVRLVCHSTKASNKNGTNGKRINELFRMCGFFASFPSPEELEKVADYLTDESREYGIQFILDDISTRDEGFGIRLFYKMSVLRSALV